MNKAAAIIFLGPPGSGKGTQSERLAEALGWPAISTGEMLRKEVASQTVFGMRVRVVLEAGQLLSDDEMNVLVEQRLRRNDCRGGFILDGFPRTRGQACFLDDLLRRLNIAKLKIFDFTVSAEELIERLKKRRQCPECGRIYSSITLCEKDGAVLAARTDDRPEAIRERLAIYDRNADPLVSYYRRRDYHLIRAGAPADAVTEKLLRFIDADVPALAATRS